LDGHGGQEHLKNMGPSGPSQGKNKVKTWGSNSPEDFLSPEAEDQGQSSPEAIDGTKPGSLGFPIDLGPSV